MNELTKNTDYQQLINRIGTVYQSEIYESPISILSNLPDTVRQIDMVVLCRTINN
jgi:hypothetical protein